MQSFFNITDTTATTILQEFSSTFKTKNLSKSNYEIIICNTNSGDSVVNLFLDDESSSVADVFIMKNTTLKTGETIILNKRGTQFQTKSLVVQLTSGSVDVSIFTSLSVNTNSSGI
jgi:hypothetical protein|tara:strand:- start:700 stop:1047 length:348 start_codon:yes stop_codon:yes gene_type:complete